MRPLFFSQSFSGSVFFGGRSHFFSVLASFCGSGFLFRNLCAHNENPELPDEIGRAGVPLCGSFAKIPVCVLYRKAQASPNYTPSP